MISSDFHLRLAFLNSQSSWEDSSTVPSSRRSRRYWNRTLLSKLSAAFNSMSRFSMLKVKCHGSCHAISGDNVLVTGGCYPRANYRASGNKMWNTLEGVKGCKQISRPLLFNYYCFVFFGGEGGGCPIILSSYHLHTAFKTPPNHHLHSTQPHFQPSLSQSERESLWHESATIKLHSL